MVQLIYCQFQKHKTPIKFIISGMTAAGVDFFCIYFLHSVLLVNVVLSATIAYAIAFFVSFCLQKFWTFSDNDKERMSGQMILYLIVGLINLSINAGLIYLLIEKYDTWPIVKNIFSQSRLLHPLISLIDKYKIWYVFVQGFIAGMLGVGSFLIYKFIIFRKCRKFRKTSDKSFKIVMAAGSFPPDISGPATYASSFAREFADNGYNVKILTYGKKIDNSEFKIYTVAKHQNLLLRYIKYFWKMFFLSSKADIVYSFDAISTGFPCALVKLLNPKLRLVTRLGGDYQWEQASQKGYADSTLREYYNKKNFNLWEKIIYSINNFVLLKSNKIIFNSQFLRDIYLNSRRLIHKNKTVIIKNIEPDFTNICAINKDKNKIKLVFAGRMIKIRNLKNFVESFAEIDYKKYHQNIVLEMIGGGPEEREIKKYIKFNKLEKRIKIFGPMKHGDLMKKIIESDILVLPSLTEINSNFIAEGLKMGKVIIHTKESELGYLGIKSDKIFYIDPLSVDDMKKKIEKAIEYFLANKNDNLADNDVMSNIFWEKEKIIDAHLQVFDSLI
ncbi:hypothetical protein A2331_03035 [Candidatus Falkowbacteria bacterium RIFOXYB2_FULL_34_18]|uniref:Glycosyl transferase family 1 domain-containing protein n=1 Tax=Candidatus Falkowbacteria bacterium RIFOXYD2_FULL_34_120 TaxID=1798007 RepID=A0A1F5TNN3_9BACT|nr:MAG: hypothetical protein A2331_03035 [Candidatus Falkowbacteria bacterium RIFOXYB2_FULL_34_18]OGF28317.1 MAG: hypothetical protein A2500_02905 [Candidatus Falkowbacteria bacterium RIFOXYC12_FULL_34_55]OGF37964.1 MAG: hypothetical protein A2466_06180 [Candidatus Falkowbacteria bacterium RIFOXYC2_FULL_34_220]OGF40121.1 MAG: hypothetical protein A2531_05170 [Candidatus Falkowbacteria bacterium RIFOXYD2_FULL_34_120]